MNAETFNSRMLYPAALLLGLTVILGSENQVWSDERRLKYQIAEYHGFMLEHPKASTRIRENPQLVYDNKFLKNHREVGDFLKRRPELRHEIAKRPHRVFEQYYRDYRDDHRYGRYDRDDRRFEWWRH
ncbi:MAG TPA: hypothetical protein VI585_01955 [Candidatus Binatia bacterium]